MSNLAISDYQDYEMINGQIYAMARPVLNHIRIGLNISAIFKSFLKGKTCKVYPEPDLFLDDGNNFVPDVVILCDRNKAKKNAIYGAPDLVVEILSPRTAKFDIGEKKDAYSKHGVKEYWVVDPVSKMITVHWHDGDMLRANNVYIYRTPEEQLEMSADDLKALVPSFKTSLYDDLDVNLADVFEDVE